MLVYSVVVYKIVYLNFSVQLQEFVITRKNKCQIVLTDVCVVITEAAYPTVTVQGRRRGCFQH